MFTMYKLLLLSIVALFFLTMTLVPLYSSMVMVKSTKASLEGLSLNVPQSKDDSTVSYD